MKRGPGMGSAREESALNMFRQMDLKGQAQDDTQLHTVHQNTISTLRIYEEAGGFVRKFSSKFPSSRLGSGFMGLTSCDHSKRCRWASGHLATVMMYVSIALWL